MVSETTVATAEEETRLPGDAAHLWRAVLNRDARYDGAFVYAVRSTHIYCRPSCPSRRPGPEKVVFYPVPEAAEQAGYRSCRRCTPDRTLANDPRLRMVRAVCRYVDESPDDVPTMDEIAAHLHESPHRLQRVFKRVMGITPRQYADARRVERVKANLHNGEDVTSALYNAGYGASSRLYEQASAQLGMTPASYRKGGQGAVIIYAIVDSPLGRLLVGATEKGVCAVSLGDDDDALEAALTREYPRAQAARDDEAMQGWIEGVLACLDGRPLALGLPLDIRATAFQRQAWEALRAIPYGQTRSYGEIAEALGRTGAARAVAQACANNPLALVIPCHRVVRGDGHLGGYRWGVARKAALLARERNEQ